LAWGGGVDFLAGIGIDGVLREFGWKVSWRYRY